MELLSLQAMSTSRRARTKPIALVTMHPHRHRHRSAPSFASRAGQAAKEARAAQYHSSLSFSKGGLQRAKLLHLTEQMAKQRKALEVELRTEQLRRSEREMSDEQWADRVHELQEQYEVALAETAHPQSIDGARRNLISGYRGHLEASAEGK